MYAAFADRERAHADVLLQCVTVTEQDVLTVKLLLENRYTVNRVLEQPHPHTSIIIIMNTRITFFQTQAKTVHTVITV